MAKAIDYPADTRNKSRIWFIQQCLARRRKTECLKPTQQTDKPSMKMTRTTALSSRNAVPICVVNQKPAFTLSYTGVKINRS